MVGKGVDEGLKDRIEKESDSVFLSVRLWVSILFMIIEVLSYGLLILGFRMMVLFYYSILGDIWVWD